MRWRFIHIPKTGGTAISAAYGRGTEPGHPHLPASAFAEDVRRFAIIREPIDRAVSICAYLLRTKNRELTEGDFREWVADGCWPDWHSADLVVRSWRGQNGLRITNQQCDWLAAGVELLLYERLREEVGRYFAGLGMPCRRLLRLNASCRRRPAISYCDGPTARLLEDRYWDDFELWRKVERGEVVKWT